MKKADIALISLGCPKNQVDAECMSAILKKSGYRITADTKSALCVIINTCGFIESAKKEAISVILDAADLKKDNCRFIVVTGCLAQRYAEEIKNDIPEVDAILGVSSYSEIAELLDRLFGYSAKDGEKTEAQGESESPENGRRKPYISAEYSEKGRISHLNAEREASDKYFAYLKISEGCLHSCAYCAIPLIRGKLISRPETDCVKEAERLFEQGVKELIIVGQDTTAYAQDFGKKDAFPDLLAKIADIGFMRVRFLYAYASGLTEKLFKVMNDKKNIVPYIDLPIQHASDKMLKKMRRPDRKSGLRRVISELRAAVPGVTLRTTVLLGFPGETDEDFRELMDFISEIKFDMLGSFIFSAEEGTAAFEMRPAVSESTAKKRQDELMNFQAEIYKNKIQSQIGKKQEVLIEGISEDGIFYEGRLASQAPDIDPICCVLSQNEDLIPGCVYNVKLVDVQDYDLIGVI